MTTDQPSQTKRRGRPSLPEEDRKSTNLKFRTRAGLREKLEAAAEENGRSLSEEVEYRLERSEDYKSIYHAIDDGFRRNMRLIFGGEHHEVAIIEISRHWTYIVDSIKEQFGQKWFEIDSNVTAVQDAMASEVRRVVLRMAARERETAAEVSSN